MMLRIAVAAALFLPLLAHAAGTAKLAGVDDQGRPFSASVEYSGDHLRAASPQQPNTYLLSRGGKVYAVSSVNGQQVVMEAADLMRVAGGLMPSPTAALEQVSAIVSLQPTTRRETVAGLDGTVYVLTYEDGQRRRRTEELVLSPSPAASELTSAAVRLGKTLAKLAGTLLPKGADELAARLQADGLGLLRFGDRFKVEAIDDRPPASQRFELPSGSFQLPDLRGLLPGLGGR
ncbi:MAG: hypothetical protein QHC78_06035 [Pigmentiphaga sp.]|uniref:hypothetical protein n=1 Tax=Pigmentiphaga sp. TaxID=1977564 RepID=UPI0029A6BE95|nr:hypothetical protein [Pigmentiphaga sp.]MDX3905234.1 hypothetical protein [Pigmentiphaga sp.]